MRIAELESKSMEVRLIEKVKEDVEKHIKKELPGGKSKMHFRDLQ